MKATVRTLIIRDRAGYEVRDYGEPSRASSSTILTGQPSGIHIVGRSGVNETLWLSTEANRNLWRKVRKLSSPDSVSEFMNAWGQITRWLTDDGTRPYSEGFILIEPHLTGLKYLADIVEAGDRLEFSAAISTHNLFSRTNITVDVTSSEMPIVIEASSLLRFCLFEMWNELGGERSTQMGFRKCLYCGHAFQVGGRRGTQTRRGDARYCSASCKNMASRSRKSMQPDAASTLPR